MPSLFIKAAFIEFVNSCVCTQFDEKCGTDRSGQALKMYALCYCKRYYDQWEPDFRMGKWDTERLFKQKRQIMSLA